MVAVVGGSSSSDDEDEDEVDDDESEEEEEDGSFFFAFPRVGGTFDFARCFASWRCLVAVRRSSLASNFAFFFSSSNCIPFFHNASTCFNESDRSTDEPNKHIPDDECLIAGTCIRSEPLGNPNL